MRNLLSKLYRGNFNDPAKGNRNIYILSVLLTVLAYWINKNNLFNVSILIVLIGVLLSIIDIKKGAVYFFVMSLAFSDFTYEGVFGVPDSDEGEGKSLGGIYMASVAGPTLMVYWCIINLFLILLKTRNWAFNKIRGNKIFRIFKIIIFFSFVGLIFNLNSIARYVPRTAVSDIRIFVNIILGFLTVHLLVTKKQDLEKYFKVFMLIFLVQLVLTILSSYSISRERQIYSFFSGTESYLVGVAFLFLLYSVTNKEKKVDIFSNPGFTIAGMLVIMCFMFIVANRGRMLGLAFAVVGYLIYSKKFAYAAVLPIFVLAAIYLVELINPNFYNFFLWKFTTFNPMVEGGESARIRYISLVNILNELVRNPYYFFFGKGLGGYFEAKYMSFEGLLGWGSFAPNWIAEGKFYKAHGMILYSLLKYGIVMSFLLWYSILKFSFRNLKIIAKTKPCIIKGIAISLLINIPFIFITIYSSKLQLMFGMLIAFAQISVNFLLNSEGSNKIQHKKRLMPSFRNIEG